MIAKKTEITWPPCLPQKNGSCSTDQNMYKINKLKLFQLLICKFKHFSFIWYHLILMSFE